MFYSLNVEQYAKAVGIDKSNAFKELKELTEKLLKEVVTYKVPGEQNIYLKFQIASEVLYNTGEQTLSIKFHEKFIPLISKFEQGCFTSLHVGLAKMKSLNSCNLYQIVKRDAYRGKFILKLEDLQTMMGLNYKLFADFRLKVIEPSLKEILDKTGMSVGVEYIKVGKKVDSVRFIINPRSLG